MCGKHKAYVQIRRTHYRRLRLIKMVHDQKGVCPYCGQTMWHPEVKEYFKKTVSNCKISRYRATIEHITPKSQGGPWTSKNLVAVCSGCNSLRGDMDLNEFKKKVANGELNVKSKKANRRQKREARFESKKGKHIIAFMNAFKFFPEDYIHVMNAFIAREKEILDRQNDFTEMAEDLVAN